MRDPRGGKGIHIQLEGDGAWPDLATKGFEGVTAISVSGLARGTVEGRASVAIRFDTKSGRTVVGEMTMREFHNVWTALVSRYGEDWMKPATRDLDTRMAMVVQELTTQLLAAKAKLGEPPTLDLTAADRAYEAYKQREGKK